jgi:hypothetical protein
MSSTATVVAYAWTSTCSTDLTALMLLVAP